MFSIYKSIKKYFLILAIFFIALTTAHIWAVYLFDGSKIVPEVWWTVNIWLVWEETPSLNPFSYGKDNKNDLILKYLYRSLLRYNWTTKQLEWDLVTCDLWTNFSKIKCFLKQESKWSDWTSVTKEDIFKTYEAIKQTDSSAYYKKILENLEIIDKWDYIEFNTKNPDTFIIDVFFFPIVKWDQITKIIENKVKPEEFITTWYYKYYKKEVDNTYNSKKVIIVRNEIIPNKDVYIGKYVFRFFVSPQELVNQKDSLNVIYENNWVDIKIPRLREYGYVMPQYISMFLNQEKVSEPLRKIILNIIDVEKLKKINKKTGKTIKNPLFWDEDITPELKNKDISVTLESLWYYKTEKLIKNAEKNIEEKYNNERKISIPKWKYFLNDQVSFLNSSEAFLNWTLTWWVQAVYINEYKLSLYKEWDKQFSFKIWEALKNIKEWENIYDLFFEINWKKVKADTIKVYYSKDNKFLEQKKKEIINNLAKKEPLSEQEKSELQLKKDEEIKKISNLDKTYYYDKDYNKLTINFYYSTDNEDIVEVSKEIAQVLNKSWININPKELSSDDLKTIISEWKKDYDMIVTWISLWTLNYNIAPFFHSSQAKVWFNFSKVRNHGLDPLLEDLKSRQFSQEKLVTIRTQINKILKEEAIVKTIYSPFSWYYIDRSIEQIQEVEVIPHNNYLYYILENSYIKKWSILNLKEKSLGGFVDWINKKIK